MTSEQKDILMAKSDWWDKQCWRVIWLAGVIFLLFYSLAIAVSTSPQGFHEEGGPSLPPVFDHIALSIMLSLAACLIGMTVCGVISHRYCKKAGIC